MKGKEAKNMPSVPLPLTVTLTVNRL